MKDQHAHIKGYRDLTEADVALMNRIKEHAILTEALANDVNRRIAEQYDAANPAYAEPKNKDEEIFGTKLIDTPEQTAAKTAEKLRLAKANPFRWHAIANTHLQEGYMALVRAVAQPSTY